MNQLFIGIPTYKRPLLLEKLINSIYECSIDENLISSIDILIVDNDLAKTAEVIATKFQNICPDKFKLHYHSYPIKGLSNVRNEILNKAFLFEPTYIIFVDDDEYVTKYWLNELVHCIDKNKCDMAMGPVIPEFEKQVPAAISKWFFLPEYENHEKLDFIMTGNLAMRTKFLVDHQLRFDKRFNNTGAEDTYFGISVLKKNGTIYYAQKAIAYENISIKRATLSWLLQRKFNGANNYISMLILEKGFIKILKKIIVSFIYFFIGIWGLILLPFKFKNRYFGIIKIAESLGGFTGLINIRYNEYLKNNR